MKLGFDCDDILAAYTSALAERYNAFQGTSYCPEDITPLVKKWGERLGSDMERQLWELSTNDEFCLTLPPVAGAVEGIAQLHTQGNELYVITGREKTPHSITLQWLQTHFGDAFAEVFYSNSATGQTKGDIAQRLGLATVVEDIPYHIFALQQRGIPVIVLDYAWNREVQEGERIFRAQRWNDIVSLVSQFQ